MPDRKPGEPADQNPISARRRSPRFLPINQISVQTRGIPTHGAKNLKASNSFSTPPGACITKNLKNGNGVLQNGGRKDTDFKNPPTSRRKSARLDNRTSLNCLDLQEQNIIEKRVTRSSFRGRRSVNNQDSEFHVFPEKGYGGTTELRNSVNPGEGLRRSARLDDKANVGKSEEVYVIEKRVTRSSTRRNKAIIIEISDSDSEEDSGKRARILSKGQKAKTGVDSCKKNIENIEKRVTRSCSLTKKSRLVGEATNVTCNMGNDAENCDAVMRNGDRNCKGNANVGEKRKRGQVEEECETVLGWTKEQELALRRAYFTAKPTPHFWKKVARMVPGKSGKECFDRIHSDHSTPSQPKVSSRPRKKESSPILFSASKLLSSSEKTKKLKSRRRSTLAALKTVRQLLQKQQKEDRDYEADLFSILEPTTASSPLNFKECTPFSSPAPSKGSSVLTSCRRASSSAQRNQQSRLNNSHKASFVSPPVLKQVKNKALHEKYIDHLHCRDAKRKAAALRKGKNGKEQIDENVSLLRPNLVKVAKEALVSDAQDAINKLRSLQSGTNDGIDDNDDDDSACLSDVNEDEDDEIF